MTAQTIETHAVCGVCFAELVGPIIKSERDRHETDHGNAPRNVQFASGFVIDLAREAKTSPRRLYGIVRSEFPTVGLRDADNLLTALDRNDLMQSLEVYRRPRGRRIGVGAGQHIYACPKYSSARRLAAVEPSRLHTAPAAEGFAASTRGGEAEAPAAEGRAAA